LLPKHEVKRLKQSDNMNGTRFQARNARIMQCANSNPTETRQKKTDEIATTRRQTLINSAQTPRGSAEILPDLRTRQPNPNESHHRAGVPRLTPHIRTQPTGERERKWRGTRKRNRLPRRSSCGSRGAGPSRGQKGP
jgi:hypothetical protein